MKRLPPEDQRFLNAAEGWLGLGDHISADKELDEITPSFRAHPDVLTVRYGIYAKAKEWDGAAAIAGALVKLMPHEAASWIWFAYATRRKSNGSIDQAKMILLKAEAKFPSVYLIPFNLACYESQLKRFAESEQWLKRAMAIDEHIVKQLAVNDPDLVPLWDSLGGTMWKME